MIRLILLKFLLLFCRFYLSLRVHPNPDLVKIYNDVLADQTEKKELSKLDKLTKEYLKKGYVSNKKLYIMRTLAKKYQGRSDVKSIKLEGFFNA